MKIFQAGCALTLALAMSTAHGFNQEIRATFQPDPTQPGKNLFVNKTPNTGYCASYPAQCADHNIFSIEMPVRFDSTRFISRGEPMLVKAPADWRQLTVTNMQTQETETVEVRIIGIGSTYILGDSATSITGVSDVAEAHDKLWDSSGWVYVPEPCRYSGVASYGTHSYRFFWKTPVQAGCSKNVAYRLPSIAFDKMDFAYELRTPNPLGMSTGQYTGSVTYTLGGGRDFVLGGLLLQPDDPTLTLDFVLDVQHTLKVDLPPGGTRVTLEPVGGWEPWINSGRKPTRIFADQVFYISASSRFKVMMLCNSYGGNVCNLGSPKGDTAPVHVSMSLPSGISGPGGGPVNRISLDFNRWSAPFQPGVYVERKPGYLHFDMASKDIDFLLRPGKNDRLRGNVTIIWDSEV
ncbi:hypothetical protein [Pseudomonas siliginis]|uniref:hypothetical protein n=1 Tax=Pseudomonas siliginis TaxID=2842346 RepID=UPI002092DC4D|nr:hypothetical protein [Pseudomonas siliginis]UST78749.1 hypothetical protein NF676_21695 [Pseudomonas siliginis]